MLVICYDIKKVALFCRWPSARKPKNKSIPWNYFKRKKYVTKAFLCCHKTYLKHNCCVFQPAFRCWVHPKADWNNFFSRFQPFFLFINLFQWFHVWNHFTLFGFFLDFRREITEKGLKRRQKVENGWKKVLQPVFGCAQHLKAGQNTQHRM